MDAKQIKNLLAAYHDVRDHRRECESLVNSLKGEEKALCDRLMTALKKAGLKKIADDYGRNVAITKKKIVRVDDWDQFYKHIQSTGEFDLLHRRPSVTAFVERAAEGEKVPGSRLETLDDLSFTTTKSK